MVFFCLFFLFFLFFFPFCNAQKSESAHSGTMHDLFWIRKEISFVRLVSILFKTECECRRKIVCLFECVCARSSCSNHWPVSIVNIACNYWQIFFRSVPVNYCLLSTLWLELNVAESIHSVILSISQSHESQTFKHLVFRRHFVSSTLHDRLHKVQEN